MLCCAHAATSADAARRLFGILNLRHASAAASRRCWCAHRRRVPRRLLDFWTASQDSQGPKLFSRKARPNVDPLDKSRVHGVQPRAHPPDFWTVFMGPPCVATRSKTPVPTEIGDNKNECPGGGVSDADAVYGRPELVILISVATTTPSVATSDALTGAPHKTYDHCRQKRERRHIARDRRQDDRKHPRRLLSPAAHRSAAANRRCSPSAEVPSNSQASASKRSTRFSSKTASTLASPATERA